MKARNFLSLFLFGGLLLGSVGSAGEPKKIPELRYGFPLELIEFGQDPEDVPGPSGERDFYGGRESVGVRFSEVGTDASGQTFAGVAEGSHPEGAWESVSVKPPSGRWRVFQTWAVPGQPVVILQSGDERRGALVFLHEDGFRELATIPFEPSDGAEDWTFGTTPVAIEPERLYFREGVPEALRPFFPERAAIVENVVWWRDYAHDAERQSIEQWHPLLTRMVAGLEGQQSEFIEEEAVSLAKEVLAAEPKPLPDASRITGTWKLRSIQGGDDSAIAYPFFEGRIVVTDRPQEFAFGKTGGSQYRSGKLLPAQSEHHLVFLGGRSTDYGGSGIYSTLDGSIDSPRLDSDSGGVFFFLEPDRAVLVLDVREGAWEIYEMIRRGDEGL